MLRDMRVVAPIFMNILNETSYAVFTFCRFSLFLRDLFFILFTFDHNHYIQSSPVIVPFEVWLTAIVPIVFHSLL